MPKIVRSYGTVVTHGNQTPQRIVIHTTEGDSHGANIFAHGYGAQYVIGQDGTIYNYAPDNRIVYGTGGNNTGTIDIEIVGHASFTPAQWKQRATQLKAVSSLIAALSKKYNIPMSLNIGSGVSTHAMNSKVYPESDGHTDPGAGFPLRQVLDRAAKAAGTTFSYTDQAPATTPPPANTTNQPTDPAQQQLDQQAGDQELSANIAAIPQLGGPSLVTPSVSEDFAGGQAPTPNPVADTWQLIAANGAVSPETLRLAQMAGYSGNAAPPG